MNSSFCSSAGAGAWSLGLQRCFFLFRCRAPPTSCIYAHLLVLLTACAGAHRQVSLPITHALCVTHASETAFDADFQAAIGSGVIDFVKCAHFHLLLRIALSFFHNIFFLLQFSLMVLSAKRSPNRFLTSSRTWAVWRVCSRSLMRTTRHYGRTHSITRVCAYLEFMRSLICFSKRAFLTCSLVFHSRVQVRLWHRCNCRARALSLSTIFASAAHTGMCYLIRFLYLKFRISLLDPLQPFLFEHQLFRRPWTRHSATRFCYACGASFLGVDFASAVLSFASGLSLYCRVSC